MPAFQYSNTVPTSSKPLLQRAPVCRRVWRPWRLFPGAFLRFQVGENQIGSNGLDVADRVNRAGDVVNVRVFEATDDLHDGVHLADVAEEFVAKAFAFGR